ncbi:hypothetical protein SUGI_0462660 [Cryptomeria japonica]|nr:hypothetical protein SUGI_0462660 [Cryptomeria japonica]
MNQGATENISDTDNGHPLDGDLDVNERTKVEVTCDGEQEALFIMVKTKNRRKINSQTLGINTIRRLKGFFSGWHRHSYNLLRAKHIVDMVFQGFRDLKKLLFSITPDFY